MNLMQGGSLIAEARKRAGLTQSELAERMGTHQSVIARWETGGASPSCENTTRAVRASGFELGISITPADDHDLALIRRELALLPHERLSTMVEAMSAIARMARVSVG
jgi:transcriptional regulator with XRE-family HTH domain